ncbi:MAG: Maf family protein [Gemmatimonadota bacterium]
MFACEETVHHRRAGPPRLILASGSPRRAEILRQLGLEFRILPADIDESLLPGESPGASAVRLASEKAAARARSGALCLGCDTLVVHGGEVLGKPGSPAEAARMLARLAGDEHRVFTGIALAAPGRVERAVEETRVRFRPLQAGEIQEYVATREPLDKAGSYGIQGFGAAIVSQVEGDFFNVMGLPVPRLLELLGRFGWRYAFGALRPAGPEARPRASGARPQAPEGSPAGSPDPSR